MKYSTSPECSALQWLSKEQTAGGTQPYVFSQCQAIHARSMLPCQVYHSTYCYQFILHLSAHYVEMIVFYLTLKLPFKDLLK